MPGNSTLMMDRRRDLLTERLIQVYRNILFSLLRHARLHEWGNIGSIWSLGKCYTHGFPPGGQYKAHGIPPGGQYNYKTHGVLSGGQYKTHGVLSGGQYKTHGVLSGGQYKAHGILSMVNIRLMVSYQVVSIWQMVSYQDVLLDTETLDLNAVSHLAEPQIVAVKFKLFAQFPVLPKWWL